MAVLTYLKQHIATTDASTFTFSSTSTGGANDIGSLASDRMVIVGGCISATTTTSRNIASISIGGVTTATALQVRRTRSATNFVLYNSFVTNLVTALVSSATTANVVLTATTTVANAAVTIWTATHVGASFATWGTLTTATVGYASSTGSASMSVTVNTSGFYVAQGHSANGNLTWTGATSDHNTTIESTNIHSGANGATTGTVTLSSTATVAGTFMIGSVWGSFDDNTPATSAETLYRTFLPIHSAPRGRRGMIFMLMPKNDEVFA